MGRRRLGAVAVAVALLAGACHSDGDDTKAQSQGVLDVKPDDKPVCMQVTEDLPPEVTKLPVIDCTQPHTHEIYATVLSTESVYPGVDALGSFAQVKCLTAFQGFVGISAFDSELSYTWLVPTLKSWNDHKDRSVLCVLARRDGAPLVGSMRGQKV